MQRKQSIVVALACFVLLFTAAGAPSFAEAEVAEPAPADPKTPFRRPAEPPRPSAATLGAIAVGRALFFSTALSSTGSMSCGTCHDPDFAWRDRRAHSLDNRAIPLPRRSPTLLDLAGAASLTWDGRKETLEQQALDPILNPRMGGLDVDTLLARVEALVAGDPALEVDYITAFATRDIAAPIVAAALAAFEASLVSPPAPFDRWVEGDPAAIPPAAQRGFALFTGRGNCTACHVGWRFTDDGFHDIGLPGPDLPGPDLPGPDLGRGALLPTEPMLQHAFKTPTLRGVAIGGPYMHDGSLPTLDAVLDHYDGRYVHRESLDPDLRDLGLSTAEHADLRAFLETLSPAPPESAPAPSIMTGLGP